MNRINNDSKINSVFSQKREGSFGFLKWIFLTELIILLVIFIISSIYRLIPDKFIFELKHNLNQKLIFPLKETVYDYSVLERNINDNGDLSKEEKEFIKYYLINEIKENSEYIDIEKISKRLSNIKTYFNDEYNNKIAGSYNSFFNIINIYKLRKDSFLNKEILDFNNCNKEAYFHELNHMLSKNSINTVYNKSIFLESINELFTREYYYGLNNNEDNYKNGYDDFIVLAYSMSELLPEDTIRKYKFDNNESILIESLLEIDNNFDEAYKLISSANKILHNQNDKKNYIFFHNSYKHFFEVKNGNNLNNNIIILLYFYNSSFQTAEERKIVRDYFNLNNDDEIIDIKPKGYYSYKYKEQCKNVKIEIKKAGQIKNIEINY